MKDTQYRWIMVIIIIVVIIAGTCGYVLFMQKTPAQIPATPLSDKICSSLPVTSMEDGVAPAGTIDAGSLIAQSESPTISGTFSNTGGIEVIIWEGKMVLPLSWSDTFSPKYIWYDGSDHGGGVWYCPVGSASGRYSDTIDIPLQEGDYTVGVYTYGGIYTDAGYQGNTPGTLIASGILKVMPK